MNAVRSDFALADAHAVSGIFADNDQLGRNRLTPFGQCAARLA